VGSSIFFGGSMIAATVAGMIALFAPCCISVMLPAYFASAFQNRRILVAMTFVFAAGVATVILPIALGASVVRQVLTTAHTSLYVVGGLVMLGIAVYLLLGGEVHLPMPGRRAGGRAGVASVYSLGIFSGMAGACCAPVLAGVIALSTAASSFALALGLGVAYVFGMVGPLFTIALLWERYDWRASTLFRPRSFTWRIGSIQRTISATNLASGLLLALIGIAMAWIGLTSDAMPSPTGWQAALLITLQHYGQIVSRALAWIPNWAMAVVLLLLGLLLARYAIGQVEGWSAPDTTAEHGDSVVGQDSGHQPPGDGQEAVTGQVITEQKEQLVEYHDA
jgi:cytochrome c-type biogenesis protein